MSGPAILTSGPQRGGVCGWIDEHGPVFAYSEAAGYALTALAAASRLHPNLVTCAQECAARIVEWLSENARSGSPPPTRVYLRPHATDWRCDMLFAFDLAMLARGLHDAACLLPHARLQALSSGVVAHMQSLIDEGGELRACQSRWHTEAPPARWSTRAGFYQLKVAAALLTRPLALGDRLATACRRIADRWKDIPAPAGELHPYLYGLEGVTLLALADGDADQLTRVRRALDQLVALRLPNGCLPGEVGNANPRSDILAQALRLLALLPRVRDSDSTSQLRAALVRSVDRSGAVLFGDREHTRSHRNVWATLFAWQALAWDARTNAGHRIATPDAMLLV